MPTPNDSLPLQQVLRDEYQSLRPGTDFSGDTPSAVYAKVHAAEPLSALCISGGGIRSATFALGAIQGMADHGLLDKFDYLSTVSGGGYIGGWLTTWIYRAKGLANVLPHLKRDAGRIAKTPGDADPIEHLREYNNYLSPRLGFFSPDTWTLAATILRNILLNWLVLVPLLLFALMLPRILLAFAKLGELYWEYYGTADAISRSPFVTRGLPALLLLSLATAFFNIARYLPGFGAKDHSTGSYLRWVLTPLFVAALAACAFDSLYFWGDQYETYGLLRAIEWTLAPAAAGCLACLIVGGKTVRKRVRPILLPLSGALVIMSCFVGAAGWLVFTKLQATTWGQYVALGPALLLIGLDLGSWVFVGISSRVLQEDDREWMARSSAWVELLSVCWVAAGTLVLLAPGWALSWKTWGPGLMTAISAVSAWFSSKGNSLPPAGAKDKPGLGASVEKFALKLAPVAFLVTFATGLSIVTNRLLVQTKQVLPLVNQAGSRRINWWEHELLLEHTSWPAVLIGAAIFFAFSWLAGRFININTFSLHGMYRNRLMRAYLGASNPRRNASRFTGFSDTDNVLMSELRTIQRPFHVVNTALNLVSGERLAWQQRKAQAFSVSPLHCGNFELGYRDSAEYGDGISLGTAVTISGAAASPNMGYHSSPIAALIMTLFNARLGAWLGNTGAAGAKSWKHRSPHSTIDSLVREALGLTNNVSPYVYLSDGGHFENLGMYEMILRRCRCIVVLDGGADPTFGYEDLGNALRKIRIDHGIPIDFEDDLLTPLRAKAKRCAVASINYAAVDGPGAKPGTLIYIKPMMKSPACEPPDVTSYAEEHPDFPHESTSDQFFDESQTESYRMLGLHTLDQICTGWKDGSLAEFAQHVADSYLRSRTKASVAAG